LIHDEVLFRTEYLDSELTQAGISQAMELKKGIESKQVSTVIVSPYLRALETCELIFGANLNRTVNVIVHPLFREQLGCACDIPRFNGSCEAERFQRFKHFNWKLIENDRWWFLNDEVLEFFPSEKRLAIREGYGKRFEIADVSATIAECMQQSYLHSGGPLESDQKFSERVEKAKEYLKQFASEGEVIVISHYKFNAELSKATYSSDEP
jgi:broad specificity phosphatase PhoE